MSYNSSTGIITGNVSIADVRNAVHIVGTSGDTSDLGTLNLRNYGPEYALYRPYTSNALTRYYDNSNGGKPALSLFKNNTRLYPESYYTSGDIYKDENYGWNINGVSYSDLFDVIKYSNTQNKTNTVIGSELKDLSWIHRTVTTVSAYRLTDWLGYFNSAKPKVVGHTSDTDIYLSIQEDQIDSGDDVQVLIDTNGITSANMPYCVPAMDHFYMQDSTKRSFGYISLVFVKHNTGNAAVAGCARITSSSTYSGLLSSILRTTGVAESLVIADHSSSTYGTKKTAICAVITWNWLDSFTDMQTNGVVPLPGYFARAAFHSFYMDMMYGIYVNQKDSVFTVSASSPTRSGTNTISVSVKNNSGYRLRLYDIRIRMNNGSTSETSWYARSLITNGQNINAFTTTNLTASFVFGYYYSTQGQQQTGAVNGDILYRESPNPNSGYELNTSDWKYSLDLRVSQTVEVELVVKYGYTGNYGWYRWKTTLQITS